MFLAARQNLNVIASAANTIALTCLVTLVASFLFRPYLNFVALMVLLEPYTWDTQSSMYQSTRGVG